MKFARCLPIVLLTALLTACAAAPVVPPHMAPRSDLLLSEDQALRDAGIDRAQLRCTGRNRWSATLRDEARLTAGQILDELGRIGMQVPDGKMEVAVKAVRDAVFWRAVLTQIVDGELHNFGAVPLGQLRNAQGQPLLLVRTGFTAGPGQPGSCVQSLVAAGVRHTVNLYAGPMPTTGLEAAEAKALEVAGGTWFGARSDPQAASFREDLREGEPAAKLAAQRAVADLINQQILRPQGQLPRGHVHIHCGGGMHRTGMVVGVFERCVNRTPMAEIAAHYQRHVGWQSDASPGGFESKNLDFIEQFDCSLIRQP